MSAPMFLASFLGCLFALAFVAIGAWGVFKWKMRRFAVQNASEIARRAKREMTPDELRQMEDFAREFATRNPQSPESLP